MRTLRTIFIVLLFTVLLIVMVQNAQFVTFNFLNWHYEVSQLLLVVIVFVIGWLTGFVGAKLTRKKKDDEPPLTTRPR
jgi:uncharacterized integral membrane protein